MELELSSLPLPIRLKLERPVSDEQLLQFSSRNRPLRVEREANGEILVMTPTGNRTGMISLRLGRLFDEWTEADGRGFGFDSRTGFRLPNGAVRSPDLAWVAKERWNALTYEEQEGFGLCPDFVIELASASDRLADVRKKITEEWIANGVELAWLIDPQRKAVEIYRPGEEPEIHEQPTSVQGDGPVSGFELVMARVWG